MFILQKLPDFKKEDMTFTPFIKDGRKAFDTCIDSVEKFFGRSNPQVVADWKKWEKDFVPENDDVNDFVAK